MWIRTTWNELFHLAIIIRMFIHVCNERKKLLSTISHTQQFETIFFRKETFLSEYTLWFGFLENINSHEISGWSAHVDIIQLNGATFLQCCSSIKCIILYKSIWTFCYLVFCWLVTPVFIHFKITFLGTKLKNYDRPSK